MQHTMIALVENKPGVLEPGGVALPPAQLQHRIAQRGPAPKNPTISRMTIVMDSEAGEARKVEVNLYKLVNVIDVQDVTNQPAVMRDLALIKVKAAPEQRAEIANLASIFRRQIVDVAPDSVIVEITGTEDKIESLLELLAPWASWKWCAPARWR